MKIYIPVPNPNSNINLVLDWMTDLCETVPPNPTMYIKQNQVFDSKDLSSEVEEEMASVNRITSTCMTK